MRYLFFDLEFASSYYKIFEICEFGYVVTDENFQILERNNFIINPQIELHEWDWRSAKKILTRDVWEYYKAKSFPYFYEDIKKIFNSVDFVFGHTLESDAKALNCECKRYNLPNLEYDFYDVKWMYKEYKERKNKHTALVKILDELNIQGEQNLHDAETDAYNTMLGLKGMLNKLEMHLSDMIELCPSAKDNSNNYPVDLVDFKNKRIISLLKFLGLSNWKNNLEKSCENWKSYLLFLDNVKPEGNLGSKFEGKKIALSPSYGKQHFKQVLNLIQLITNQGGDVVSDVLQANLFVKYEYYDKKGILKIDQTLKNISEENEALNKIEVIDFADLLNQLEITEEELDKLPMVSFDFLFKKEAIIKDENVILKIKIINNNKNIKFKKLMKNRKVEKYKRDRYGNKIVYSESEKEKRMTLGDLSCVIIK
ncbi:MAG: hypothetical protein HUJ42_01155 [Malacoplasma sp.]|nr:hypothetical protein [Malacoplasma sp.]